MGNTHVDLSGVLHPLTGEPITPLGYRADGRPIWPIMGGAPGDDEDEDEGGGDDEDEDEGGGDDEEEDPFDGLSAKEKAAIAKSFAKAKTDARRWREFAQGKTDVAPDGTKRKTKPDEDEDDKGGRGKGKTFTRQDLEDTREEARAAGRDELMPVLIEVAATHALTEAGMILPKNDEAREAKLARVMRMMDADDVRVEDGKLVGLSDAVAGLKRDFPEWFGKGGTNGRPPRPGNAGGGRSTKDKPKSATEIQMGAIFGNRD
jgi:hypothetical protein